MKVLFSVGGGKVQLVEDGGVIKLSIDESVNVGDGSAKGLLKASGKAEIELDAMGGLKLGESLLNAHLPMAVQPLAVVVEGIANQAIAALE